MSLVKSILILISLNHLDRAVKEFKRLCIDDIDNRNTVECDAMHLLIKLHLLAVFEVMRG